MPPKRTRSTSAKTAKRSSTNTTTNDDDASAMLTSSSNVPTAVLPLDPARAGQSTAASLFAKSSVPQQKQKQQQQQQRGSDFSGMDAAALANQINTLPDIDEAILQHEQDNNSNGNSFLAAVATLVGNVPAETLVNLLCGFLSKTSVVSAKSFFFALATTVDATSQQQQQSDSQSTSGRGGKKKNLTTTTQQSESQDANAPLRAVAALISAATAPSSSAQQTEKLRGSVTEAAKSVFFPQHADISSSSNRHLVEPSFSAALRVLVAAVDAGRMVEVKLLGAVLDGIACAAAAAAACTSSSSSAASSSSSSSPLIPIQMLREAAELLTTLGRFATIGAPRLRGMISAWNAPTLPAKKEASVVAGGPFKINVAPEFEVRHLTMKM